MDVTKEDEDMADYTVSLITDNGYTEHCKPLAIGVDNAIAKSIRRWFEKNVCSWSDYSQTGSYITIVSRKYCTNHADFEVEY